MVQIKFLTLATIGSFAMLLCALGRGLLGGARHGCSYMLQWYRNRPR
jgi:hypothetical protein